MKDSSKVAAGVAASALLALLGYLVAVWVRPLDQYREERQIILQGLTVGNERQKQMADEISNLTREVARLTGRVEALSGRRHHVADD